MNANGPLAAVNVVGGAMNRGMVPNTDVNSEAVTSTNVDVAIFCRCPVTASPWKET
jgi:hypothetical protein